MASHWIRTHAFAKHFSICLKRGDRSCSFSIYVVWNLTSLLFNFRKSFYLAQRGDGPHTCRLPLVWQPTSLTTEPLWLGFDYHNRHYIWYIWLVALITKVFLAWLKTCSGGTGTHACRLPLVWQPTPLPTKPLWLGFEYHVRHYILFISNIFGNYWNGVRKSGQVLWVRTQVEALWEASLSLGPIFSAWDQTIQSFIHFT